VGPDMKSFPFPVEKTTEGTVEEKGIGCTLVEALALKEREVISLVGAGGKTTLMFRLAEELLRKGKDVVTTTTTKIMEPSLKEAPALCVDSDEERLKDYVRNRIGQDHHITIAGERIGTGKLKGISPKLVAELSCISRIDYILVEADGASGRPVKAPREKEPVIPSCTTLVVAIAGIDGIGAELNEENTFQPERISRLTGIPLGGRLTEEAMAVLMTHPEGVGKGTPPSSRVLVFLNKADIPGGVIYGRQVAQNIFKRRGNSIDRVVLGQLKKEPPVVEVLIAARVESGPGRGR
jgi:probable selenium-dependent hydroxylase accessory protein YqeC